jgi:hypothetical protein
VHIGEALRVDPTTIEVKIYEMKKECGLLFRNYLIYVEDFGNGLCRFVKKFSSTESLSQFDKPTKEIMAYKGNIPLIHESYRGEVKLNRRRMDSSAREFE